MTRLMRTVRLLKSHQAAACQPARCAHRNGPFAFTQQPSSSIFSSHTTTRQFSSTPPPPPSDANPPSSAAQRDDGPLAATAQLVSATSPSPGPSPDATAIYTSPFISAVRRMKLFSLSSCGLSLVSAPLLLVLASPSIPLSGRLAMGTAVAAFGIGTTLALTKFTQPYVIRVWSAPTTDTVLFETLNVWARPRYRSVPVVGLRPLYNRLLSNVRALHAPPAETPSSDYFLHADIVDHPLLKPLVEHSLPLPEEQSDGVQQAETTLVEQTAAPQQPAADTAPKQR